MTTTEHANLQDLLLAMEQLVSGERSISEFRDEMLNLLYENPSHSSSVHQLVGEYQQRGLIPEQVHRLLSREIDKAITEELPTSQTAIEPTAPDIETTSATADVPEVAASPARKPSLRIGELLRDRFEIIGRASGGSMGVVYKAIDRRIAEVTGGEPAVAIKVIAPEYNDNASAARALQQEAAKGRYLQHPNIVRFLDVDRHEGQVFLVMEWLAGRSLGDVLNEHPGEPMQRDQALEVIRDIGSALMHAHTMGITHADVKPGNIMVMPAGEVKLLDFGIARARGKIAGGADTATETFLQAATPAYASPAVLSGVAAKPSDDVFSLAAVAYRLFSGKRPFRDKSSLQWQQEGRVLRRIEGLDQRCWRALERALHGDESNRTPSVSELLIDLGLAGTPRPEGTWRTWFVGGLAGVLAGLFVIAFYGPSWRSTDVDGVAPAPTLSGDKVATAGSTPPAAGFIVTEAQWVEPLAEAALTIAVPTADAPIESLRLFENAGPAIVRLTAMPDYSGRVVVVEDTTASAELSDLRDGLRTPGNTTLIFDNDRRTADLVYENTADDLVEPDTELPVRLVDVETEAIVGRFVIAMRDDDRQRLAGALAADTVGFARNELTLRESDGVAALTLWRFNPRSGPLSIPLTVVPLSAEAGEDFVLPARPTATFAAGDTRATVLIPIVVDAIEERPELFQLTLAAAPPRDHVHSTVTVRILDAP
ncbi:MAG: protein kinase [Pseudomonadota bacterium]